MVLDSLPAAELTMMVNDALPQQAEYMDRPGDVEAQRPGVGVRVCVPGAGGLGRDGKPATAAGLLGPAVACEAYRQLDLWRWERAYDKVAYGTAFDDLPPEADAVRAEAALHSWRSAGKCLALDRLWWPGTAASLVDVGSTKARRSDWNPVTAEQWRDLALVLTTGLCQRFGQWVCEPLVDVLGPAVLSDDVAPMAEIRQWWPGTCPAAMAEVLADSWEQPGPDPLPL